MHDGERIDSRSEVVHHNAGALGQPLQSPDGERFPNIEDTKEYKAREKGFPCQRDGDECNQLSGDFVDDDELRIFSPEARATRVAAGIPIRVTAAAAAIVAQVRLAMGMWELANPTR
jgi:hypothetical protein